MDNPIHTGAMGKVLLAFSEPAERDEILDRTELVAYTPATITDRAVLDRELARVHEAGYPERRGERSARVAAVSAPALGPDTLAIAALPGLGPREPLDHEHPAPLPTPRPPSP